MSTAEREKMVRKSPYGSGLIPRALRPYVFGAILLTTTFFFMRSLSKASSNLNHRYGIMFDAGSTGSRIHVYTFHENAKGELLLDDELFEQVKPGLSSYPDDIPGAVASINQLLNAAKKYIPEDQHNETPLALKASAGLRILGAAKSEPILKAVGQALDASPFKQVWQPEIMDGTKEAVYSWVTLNYLAKVLGNPDKTLADSYGTLDLGGGSTQIAFHPKSEETKNNAPEGYLLTEKAFDTNFDVYIHSYLGLGLMSARQLLLGGTHENQVEATTVNSPCFKADFNQDWSNARSNYKIIGTGLDFTTCYNHAKAAILSQKVDKPSEIANQPFYAFSYYFDRAVEVGLITENGGDIKVGDFKIAAQKACNPNTIAKATENSDWLCSDLSLISSLLQDGFGFNADNKLKLYKKIDGIETQWALGATFAVFEG